MRMAQGTFDTIVPADTLLPTIATAGYWLYR